MCNNWSGYAPFRLFILKNHNGREKIIGQQMCAFLLQHVHETSSPISVYQVTLYLLSKTRFGLREKGPLFWPNFNRNCIGSTSLVSLLNTNVHEIPFRCSWFILRWRTDVRGESNRRIFVTSCRIRQQMTSCFHVVRVMFHFLRHNWPRFNGLRI